MKKAILTKDKFKLEKCPITELPAERTDTNSYRIILNENSLFIKHGFSFENLLNDDIFIKHKHLLAGAILNKQLSDKNMDEPFWFSITKDGLSEKIAKIIYPKTPKDKLNNLFKTFYQMQKFDGEVVVIRDIIYKPEFFYKHFFKSYSECVYYIDNLGRLGLINCTFTDDLMFPKHYRITFEGLNHYIELTEKGNLSNKCFVAMSFDKNMKETREAIRDVLLKNDFEPIIIDEQLIDSSQTINDAIISAIKSCKFSIADFTQQRDGVYFESGFAVGLGKPVIFTCHEDWFKQSHFDTNHFPHLIYKSNNELIDMLDNKIKAWIK